MPKGGQFGYLFTKNAGNIPWTVAHELGHGRFKLSHTFDGEYGGSRSWGLDNLMNYHSGTHLAKWQWDQMFSTALINNPFESDEETMVVNVENDIWKYGDINSDPHFIAVAVTANVVVNAYNAVGDVMLWVIEAVISDEKCGELVRKVLIDKNIGVSPDVENKTLGKMFEFKKDFREVTVKFTDGFWPSAANLGIGILDIVSLLYPASNGSAYLASKTPLILVPGQYLRSAKGLLYGLGSLHGTRIMHVLDHTTNNLKKPLHGIFNVSDVIGVIDEGWEIVQKINKSQWNKNLKTGQLETIGNVTRKLDQQPNGNIVEIFVIDMKRVIGVSGGKLGDGSALNRLMICVKQGTSEIITAYPMK